MNFFFLLDNLNDSQPTAVNDQHPCVVFAQGLKQLALPYFGNIKFLKNYAKDEYLIDTIGYFNKNTIMVTNSPHKFENELIQCYKNGNKSIILDTRDEWNRHEWDKYIPFTTYFYRSSYHISNTVENVYPFAFSLSNRIIHATEHVNMNDWENRKNIILESHRVTNHSVRNYVKNYYLSGKCPISVEMYNDNFKEPMEGTEEYFHWCQTGRRHSIEYYNKLASVQMLDAHGGYFHIDKIVQVDSWKLWEGFAAGCLVIAMDFTHYNIQLPFVLIGYKHYIPIQYDKLEESYAILHNLTTAQKKEIAENGRAYVLKHYCPESIAKYIGSNIPLYNNYHSYI